MAKLSPYQLADIFSTAYQNAQRQKQQRERYEQEKSYLERQQEIALLKELDKARRDVTDNYVPYSEDLQIKSGSQPITGSQIESGYSTLLGMTQGDLLPDEQKYVRRGDVVQPEEEKTNYFDRYEDLGTFNVDGKPVKRMRDKVTGEIVNMGEAYYKPDKTSGDGSGNSSERDFSEASGQVSELIQQYSTIDPDDQESKQVWRSKIAKPLEGMMVDAGLPIDGDIMNLIRQRADIRDGDSPETKRALLNEAVFASDGVANTKKLSERQKQAIRLYIEASTR